MTEITVPILLFTKDNFTRDIFKPLMLLIFFSSARSNPDTLSKFKGIYESINEQIKQKLTESTSEQTTQTLTDLKDAVVSGIDQINRMVGTKSITVLPPPTFKVYTRNKTINMSRAAITSVSYQFKGPYIKAGYKGLFGQLFGSSGLGPNIGDSLDRLLRDEYVKIFNFKEESFPSICEINITLKETDFIDGDEYYKNLMSDSYIEILKSDKAETLLSTQIASGIAQNIGVVLPETRGTGDLLGGGKWVPPGESLSGIPGFL
jgi:hypothetical protein